MRPRLLDLFCGAGGCTKGYKNSGFAVVGVDNRPQPNYCGDDFILGDALEVLARLLAGEGVTAESGRVYFLADFAAIHASPPCQFASRTQKIRGNEHPDLIGQTRDLLEATGLPYVIENVKGAPLRDPVMLEGQMFPELRTHRPRLFETNWPLEVPVMRFSPPRNAKMGRKPKDGEWIQVVGNTTMVAQARKAMGIDWMNRDELRQAIPPAYTELIGYQLIDHLRHEENAA